VQLLLIRHALPLRSEPGQGSDPDLSADGIKQAKRLPDALARFPITRLVSSPQRRSVQTAQPVADALGLTVDTDDRLAEYDRDMAHYIPVEQIAAEYPEQLARLAQGHLPSGVDEKAFLDRINSGIRAIAEAGGHEDTVAVFTHGGVINGLIHTIMGTAKILCVNVDYAGITRLLHSREGALYVAAVNGTEHVWDLLPRNARW
jgi:broad specificity phosphatase PhoE